MIIVSQNKTKIFNFDNINYLHMYEVFDNDFAIEINYSDCNYNVIAKYETEERAKEVLQEIIERYTNWENFKVGQPEGICSPKYEMPEK